MFVFLSKGGVPYFSVYAVRRMLPQHRCAGYHGGFGRWKRCVQISGWKQVQHIYKPTNAM